MAKKRNNINSTIKQKRAVRRIGENQGNISKSMREVGYSPKTAKNPKNLTESKGYKKEAKSFIEQLEEEKQLAIKAITKKKRNSARYKELVESIEKLTKLTELLSGGATERAEIIGSEIEPTPLEKEMAKLLNEKFKTKNKKRSD